MFYYECAQKKNASAQNVLMRFFCERDSSGTTEGRMSAKREMKPEGDGADSPTRAPKGREAARPKY